MRYAGVAMKESSAMILHVMSQGVLEARANTEFAKYRIKLWYHVDDAASVEAACAGAITHGLKEDVGAFTVSRVVGGGVGVGLAWRLGTA